MSIAVTNSVNTEDVFIVKGVVVLVGVLEWGVSETITPPKVDMASAIYST